VQENDIVLAISSAYLGSVGTAGFRAPLDIWPITRQSLLTVTAHRSVMLCVRRHTGF
jgi:hypothetical protein